MYLVLGSHAQFSCGYIVEIRLRKLSGLVPQSILTLYSESYTVIIGISFICIMVCICKYVPVNYFLTHRWFKQEFLSPFFFEAEQEIGSLHGYPISEGASQDYKLALQFLLSELLPNFCFISFPLPSTDTLRSRLGEALHIHIEGFFTGPVGNAKWNGLEVSRWIPVKVWKWPYDLRNHFCYEAKSSRSHQTSLLALVCFCFSEGFL